MADFPATGRVFDSPKTPNEPTAPRTGENGWRRLYQNKALRVTVGVFLSALVIVLLARPLWLWNADEDATTHGLLKCAIFAALLATLAALLARQWLT